MTAFLVAPLHGDAETLASQHAVITRLVTDLTQSSKAASQRQRVGEFLLVFSGFVPKLVLEHEFGHARSLTQDGGHPRVRLLSWWQGECDPGDFVTDREEVWLRFDAAGVNQCMVDAGPEYAVCARSGSVGYPEALDFLLSQTNPMLYAGRSPLLDRVPWHGDDIATYRERLKDAYPISAGRLFLVSALADPASGPVWAALRGQAQFVKKGAGTAPMPRLRLGNATATYPNFQVFLTPEGLVIGGTTFVGDDPRRAVQASLHRSDSDATWALGERWHDLPAGEQVLLSPYVRVTVGDRSGRAVGVAVREVTQRRVSLMGRAEYVDDDLLADAQGKRDGWTAYVGIVARLS